jgi:hypothetical protein
MKIIISLFVIVLSISFLNCSGCDGENPTVMLINNGTGKADIQIKTSGGNTENINNVLVGTQSDRRSFAEGDVEFTINIQGANDPVVYNLRITTCRDYIITINSDNSVTSSFNDRD